MDMKQLIESEIGRPLTSDILDAYKQSLEEGE